MMCDFCSPPWVNFERLFGEECDTRGLDASRVPDHPARALSVVRSAMLMVLISLYGDPAGLKYLSAGLAAWSHIADTEAERMIAALTAHVFGEDGPTAPD